MLDLRESSVASSGEVRTEERAEIAQARSGQREAVGVEVQVSDVASITALSSAEAMAEEAVSADEQRHDRHARGTAQ